MINLVGEKNVKPNANVYRDALKSHMVMPNFNSGSLALSNRAERKHALQLTTIKSKSLPAITDDWSNLKNASNSNPLKHQV
jgi:hypothetical protein